MNNELLTPEQFANIMRNTKPHLISIEDEVSRTGFGSVSVTLEVRSGKVAKWSFTTVKTFLADKCIDSK